MTDAAACGGVIVGFDGEDVFVWGFCVEKAKIALLGCVGDLARIFNVPTNSALVNILPL